jgi:hypothetical protein
MPRTSFVSFPVPSAILADGPLIVPLFAVTSMSLSEIYHLPPVGSDAARVLVETHDDTLSLSAALVGPDRHIMKLMLETLAEQSMRGSVLDSVTGGQVGGLVLWTGLTLRTDIYVKSLTFNAASGRRDAIDLSLTLEHLPRPGALAKGLDFAAAAVSTLIDPFL